MIISQLIAGLLGTWIIGTTSVVGFYSPQHVMVDVTNDFGVCVLQMISSKKENIAFSPYGLVSVALVLYEGSTGPSAAEIHNTLRLPWDREVTRVGFRDMHRYLKSYFSNDGFLRGLVLSKPNIGLRKNYTDLLQFYGFDVRTAPPRIPTTPTLAVTTTARPFTTLSIQTTKKPPAITTTVPERTTTTAAPETTFELNTRFGTTTTELPTKQTIQTTMNAKTETTPPAFRTTAERSTLAITTTRLPQRTTTLTVTTPQAPPVTTLPPTTMPPPTITTKAPVTTTQGTTTLSPQTSPSPTTNLPQTTSPLPITTLPPPTISSSTSKPTTTAAGTTTKLADSTQAGTTLDVVTMTDKKPNSPEIMSQVNISALTTTPQPEQDMQGREGDAEMDLPTRMTLPVIPTTTTMSIETTTKSVPDTTLAKEPQTTIRSPETTTTETSNTAEVSVAETTIVKSVTMVNPNTTPTPSPAEEVINSTMPKETTTVPPKLEPGAVTLVIETTTSPVEESSTEVATESMIDQGMANFEPESTTIMPGVDQNVTEMVTTTELTQSSPTIPPIVGQAQGIPIPIMPPIVGQTGGVTIPIMPPIVGQTDGIAIPTMPPIVGQTEGVAIPTMPPIVGQTEGVAVPTVPTIVGQTDGVAIPTMPPIVGQTEGVAIPTMPPIVGQTEGAAVPTVPTIVGQTGGVSIPTMPPIVGQTDGVAIPIEPPIVGPIEGIAIQTPTESQPMPTQAKPEQETMSPEMVTVPPPTVAPLPALALEEMIDSAASETGLAAALTRQQRSLFSTHKTPEHQQSGSNWVPQYYDQRWGRNPSNEFWFFTFNGGENVPAHTYTAYLPFAFIPELSCLALQLPLDDPRYFILILLPEERLGLSQLLYALQWCPVRAIVSRLKMTAVYAVVPAFTIVKHINLVPALAQMGIHSVFDPFRADLSPMTSEPLVFVRTIEQVVTVSLRKYYSSNRSGFEASPSEVQQHFVANHPFAYFVLDKETGVTLMTGTIVNPVAHNQ